ncbi:MAG: hypothetical protein MHMPM18_000180 [Marteilia pararefringens]
MPQLPLPRSYKSLVSTNSAKQQTRGLQTIVRENKEVLSFYRNLVVASFIINAAVLLLIQKKRTTKPFIIPSFSLILAYSCFWIMKKWSTPEKNSSGTIVLSGLDLSANSGTAEYLKDLILLTTGTSILALISKYFFFILLIIPIGSLYLAYNKIIKPMRQMNSMNQLSGINSGRDAGKKRNKKR